MRPLIPRLPGKTSSVHAALSGMVLCLLLFSPRNVKLPSAYERSQPSGGWCCMSSMPDAAKADRFDTLRDGY